MPAHGFEPRVSIPALVDLLLHATYDHIYEAGVLPTVLAGRLPLSYDAQPVDLIMRSVLAGVKIAIG
jgi:hypothetical protein